MELLQNSTYMRKKVCAKASFQCSHFFPRFIPRRRKKNHVFECVSKNPIFHNFRPDLWKNSGGFPHLQNQINLTNSFENSLVFM